ncbi:MAG TPA: autotransporter outer membrane beta-barrel domain-containing protein [Saprospiraceae bacterium]|nr:autotransporter outer membrane beta-barrel domain-containing protein [Saprospiraceae bacterium]
MKSNVLKWLMLFGMLIPLSIPAIAQSKKKKENIEFTDKLWVGGSINSGLQFGNRTFAFGLTPIVGYEMVPNFSIGPFVRLDYYYQRLTVSPPHIKFESLDVGPGVFARVDILRQYFAQIEYERAFLQRPITDAAGNPLIGPDNKVLKETVPQNYVYIGAGYSAGSNVRYGVSIHYNILNDAFSIRIPWDYRIGIRVQL